MVAHGVVHCDRINEDRSEIKFLDVVGVVCIGMGGSQRTGVSSDKTGAVSGMITQNRSPVDLIDMFRKQENVSQGWGALSTMYSFITGFLGKPVTIHRANFELDLGVDIWEAVDPPIKELIQKLPHPNHQDSIKSMNAFLKNGCQWWGKAGEYIMDSWRELPNHEKTKDAFHAHVAKMILIARYKHDKVRETARSIEHRGHLIKLELDAQKDMEEGLTELRKANDRFQRLPQSIAPNDVEDVKLQLKEMKGVVGVLEKCNQLQSNKTKSCWKCLNSWVKEVQNQLAAALTAEKLDDFKNKLHWVYVYMDGLLCEGETKKRDFAARLVLGMQVSEMQKMVEHGTMLIRLDDARKKDSKNEDTRLLCELIGKERITETHTVLRRCILLTLKSHGELAKLSLYTLGGALRYLRNTEWMQETFSIAQDDPFFQGSKLPSSLTGQEILDLVCSATVIDHIIKKKVDGDLILSAVTVFALALDKSQVITTIEEINNKIDTCNRLFQYMADHNLLIVKSISPDELLSQAATRYPSTKTVCDNLRNILKKMKRDPSNGDSDDNSDGESGAASVSDMTA